MKIISIVGARPNFMKISPIINQINKYNESKTPGRESVSHTLIHTGQHYDKNLSDVFFNDLNLPKPDIYLEVGSGSHSVQTALVMQKFEKVILEEKPDLVIVVGDVNSTVACALVAAKIFYFSESQQKIIKPQIAHVEAGLRSFDRDMPEEINRIITDHLSDFLFITEKSGITNLEKEGISPGKMFLVGNTMIDTLLHFKEKAAGSDILRKLGLMKENGEIVPYSLLTLHRPSNVDEEENFTEIIMALKAVSEQTTIIFPAHPRAIKNINNFNLNSYFHMVQDYELEPSKINMVKPLGYLDFLCMMMHSKIILTDSGGIQEETTCLKVPCITIRENTERPITIEEGTNVLAGCKKQNIIDAFNKQIKMEYNTPNKQNRKSAAADNNSIPQFWDGMASQRIVKILTDTFHKSKRLPA